MVCESEVTMRFLINLLEQLIVLKKTHLLTRLLIYYKRILKDTNEQPDEDIHRARPGTRVLLSSWNLGLYKVARRSILVPWCGSCLKKGQRVVLWCLYGGFITQSCLTKSLANGSWFNLKPFLPSPEIRDRIENSNPLITRFALVTASTLCQ